MQNNSLHKDEIFLSENYTRTLFWNLFKRDLSLRFHDQEFVEQLELVSVSDSKIVFTGDRKHYLSFCVYKDSLTELIRSYKLTGELEWKR